MGTMQKDSQSILNHDPEINKTSATQLRVKRPFQSQCEKTVMNVQRFTIKGTR